MMNLGIFRSRLLAGGLIAALVALVAPVGSYAADDTESLARGGTLTGNVYLDDQRTPVVNATVKIRNLNNQKEYSSPTDNKGMYRINGIDEGWYTLGVSHPAQGDFNLNYGVYIRAGETAKLVVSMKSGGILDGRGMGSGKSFFSTPAGILTLVVLAGGVAFGVYELTKKEESPVR